MSKIKSIVQVINHENGNRSEIMITDPREFAELLRESGDTRAGDYILVVASFDPDSEEDQLDFHTGPIFTIESFLKAHFPEDYVAGVMATEHPLDSGEEIPPYDPEIHGDPQ